MTYLDNAATTFPKPKSVVKAVEDCLLHYGANPGRSGHALSMKAAQTVYDARCKLAEYFGACDPERVIFTKNCTESINTAVKGIVGLSDHFIVSSLEHNSVIRPLETLRVAKKADYSVAKVFENDVKRTTDSFQSVIKSNTKAFVISHASNVFGITIPLKELVSLAQARGILVIVDGAQTAGVLPVSVDKMGIDVFCTAGHKGLYGPFGTGLMVLGKKIKLKSTLIEGGTGSSSLSFLQSEQLPDRFESGTLNLCGIAGLSAGVDFLKRRGTAELYEHEMHLAKRLYEGLANQDRVRLYTCSPGLETHVPVVSFTINGTENNQVVEILSDQGVYTRGGLQCAPMAHLFFDTAPEGTVRVSMGAFNQENDIDRTLKIVKNIINNTK